MVNFQGHLHDTGIPLAMADSFNGHVLKKKARGRFLFATMIGQRTVGPL
jgi:hypothetical protein